VLRKIFAKKSYVAAVAVVAAIAVVSVLYFAAGEGGEGGSRTFFSSVYMPPAASGSVANPFDAFANNGVGPETQLGMPGAFGTPGASRQVPGSVASDNQQGGRRGGGSESGGGGMGGVGGMDAGGGQGGQPDGGQGDGGGSGQPSGGNPSDGGGGSGQDGGPSGPTVTISIDASTMGRGFVMRPRTASFTEGESVFDVLFRECRASGIHMASRWTPLYSSYYIAGIDNLYEFDGGDLSGWMYRVNGWFPNYGASSYTLEDGDVVEWLYTRDLGRDIGGEGAVGG